MVRRGGYRRGKRWEQAGKLEKWHAITPVLMK
jgi:hypothetical protein